MKSNNTLTVILPCYNPIDSWVENVVANFTIIKRKIPEAELTIVNDGSVKNFNASYINKILTLLPETKIIGHKNNFGKGFTLREGVKNSNSDLVIYTDVDFPYTIESFMEIYAILQSGNADVVMGIRGQAYYQHLPKTRIRISKLLKWFIKTFLRIPTNDTQCGLKGFNKKGKEIFLQTTINRYLFDLEFIFLSARNNLSISTVEVELRPEIILSKMNWKILVQEFANFLKIFVRSILSH